MSTTLTIPAGYGLIVLEVLFITFHIVLTSVPINGLRAKYFNKEFYVKHFPGWKGKIPSKSGYPDMGGGRISDKLTDEEFFNFGNAQRAHYNYLEGALPIIFSLLVSGLHYTRFTFIAGLVYIIGRELYSQGYRKNGPAGRLIGVLILDVALVVLLGTAFYTAYQIGGGIEQAKLFFQP